MGDLKLVPVEQGFTKERNGKYTNAIRQFLNSGENEMAVEAADPNKVVTVYQGLIITANRLGLKDQIQVRRRGKEIHLIRTE